MPMIRIYVGKTPKLYEAVLCHYIIYNINNSAKCYVYTLKLIKDRKVKKSCWEYSLPKRLSKNEFFYENTNHNCIHRKKFLIHNSRKKICIIGDSNLLNVGFVVFIKK